MIIIRRYLLSVICIMLMFSCCANASFDYSGFLSAEEIGITVISEIDEGIDLDDNWLNQQIELAANKDDFLSSLVMANYIINVLQYNENADMPIDSKIPRPSFVDTCEWMSILDIPFTTAQVDGKWRMILSDYVYLEFDTKDEPVSSVKLCLTQMYNAYDNNICILVTF